MHPVNYTRIVSSEEELRSIIGFPSELVDRKVIASIDSHCRDFISRSPFLVLSTSDASGCCDVSPRGDAPGFVQVLDDKRLIIPERPGNRRIDSMRNLLSNPRAGLIFFIPGMGETLRINGRACIIRDEDLLEPMAVNGKRPLLGIAVEAEECFLHCAKAMKRSRLWEPESWSGLLPSASKILADHAKLPGVTAAQIEERLREGYAQRLY
ncbi:pyridoxamine 5'-phosphate oxidase family protein [Paenibacillus sp. GYB004]|uniref:pyridoxamine 5'-phosphate oxidase family protein n=1 Tax=Paenibacillus sp. GYB004 TaxID=2994393 RepID=UPI002F9654C0